MRSHVILRHTLYCFSVAIISHGTFGSPRENEHPPPLQVSAGPGDPVVDLVHTRVLAHRTARQVLDDFESRAGVRPTAVVIPINVSEGLTFSNRLGYATFVADPHGQRVVLSNAVRMFAHENVDIYLCLTPTLPFLRTGTMNIVDIIYDESPRLCINKRKSQKIFSIIVEEAIAIAKTEIDGAANPKARLRGFVLNIVNLWGMGAKNERILLTCFCPECRRSLVEAGISMQDFETFPNPWNLLLKDTGTGISHIDIGHGRTRAERIDEIVGQSMLRGFSQDAFPNVGSTDIQRLASKVYDYMQARHKITVDAAARIFRTVKKHLPDTDTILITEGTPYNWTAGCFLGDLDDPDIIDEIWFDPSSHGVEIRNVKYRSYMSSRSRYAIDAAFDFAATLGDVTTSQSKVIQELMGGSRMSGLNRRLAMVRFADVLTKGELLVLDEVSNRVGFVGSAVTDEVLRGLIEDALENWGPEPAPPPDDLGDGK